MKKKLLYIFLGIVLIGLGTAGYGYYVLNTGFDIDKKVYLYIDESKNYDALRQVLKDSAKVESISNFDVLAGVLDYKENMKSGRYEVTPGMNIYELVNKLRKGQQIAVKLKFNNIRTKEDLAKRLSDQLMINESALLDVLNNQQKCNELGFDTETVVAMFIPNTYEVYWDTDLDSFLNRMKKEYGTFWNEQRQEKAKAINMTPVEVSILASIVEEECMYSDEYHVVAGLYINRLHKGMLLQADPTVKFANGDFSIRRILHKHLAVDSPYNTYKHTGLPPGPIRVPSIKGIDAVLNYQKHGYIYMCAKEDFSGYHNFAETHAEHERNAVKYRKALNERGIYR